LPTGLDVDRTVAGDDGDRTRGEAGVDVTHEQVSHADQPFRREPTSGHALLLEPTQSDRVAHCPVRPATRTP
jgi:hypothetical protein